MLKAVCAGLTMIAVLGASAGAQSLSDLQTRCTAVADATAALAACSMLISTDQATTPQTRAIYYGNRAGANMILGNIAEAITDASEAIRLDPNEWNALNNRGRAYYLQRQYGRALADLGESIRINAQNALPYYNRGVTYAAMGQFDRAVGEYDQAVVLAPQFAAAFFARGVAHERLRLYPAAAMDYDGAVTIEPTNASYHAGRCTSRAIGNFDLPTARAACDESLRLRPNTPLVLENRGLIALRQNRFRDAWNDYNAAVRADPRSATALYGRGIAALRSGRPTEGQSDMSSATQMSLGVAGIFSGYGITPTGAPVAPTTPIATPARAPR